MVLSGVDRVAAAQSRLVSVQRDIRAVEYFCVDCRFLAGSVCTNPAAQELRIDPVKGNISEKSRPALEARDGTGLCGPEAVLFEPLTRFQLARDGLLKGLGNVALTVYAIIFFGSLLTMLLFG